MKKDLTKALENWRKRAELLALNEGKKSDLQNETKSLSLHDSLNESLNDSINQSFNENHSMKSLNEQWKEVSKSDWQELLDWMKAIGVFYPKTVIYKYGAAKVKEAMLRTKNRKPRNAGAYFNIVLKSMAA